MHLSRSQSAVSKQRLRRLTFWPRCLFPSTATPQIQNLMTVMIRQHEALFPPSKDVLPSPPRKKAESQKNAPRSFVGWESAEVRPHTTRPRPRL